MPNIFDPAPTNFEWLEPENYTGLRVFEPRALFPALHYSSEARVEKCSKYNKRYRSVATITAFTVAHILVPEHQYE